MSPLSDEKLVEIITLAEKLKHAEEHTPMIDADRMVLIRAKAMEAANDHELARYVGKELSDLEPRFIDAALKSLHPTQEQILQAKDDLGVESSSGALDAFIQSYGFEFLNQVKSAFQVIDSKRLFYISTDKINDQWGLNSCIETEKKGFFGVKKQHSDFKQLLKISHYMVRLTVTVNDPRVFVICKSELQLLKDLAARNGIRFEISH